MNSSSGIKRGLAVTAISALAVTGIPALASSAQAAPGDSFTVTYTGPALNGGDQGAVVVLRALDTTIDETLLELTSTSSTAMGSEDNGDQNAEIVDRSVSDDPTNSNYDLIKLNIAVTTTAAGQTATFRVFENDSPTNTSLDAGEARQTVSVTTAGPLADIVITPQSQSSAQGIASAPYTVTLQDAAGRTTQLDALEEIILTHDGDVTTNESGSTITADEIERGTDTFTATGSNVGAEEIDLTSTTLPVETATAILNVTTAADITAAEVDVVTGADSWDGFGDGTEPGTTLVRVDQNTIRIDFDSNDPNSTVTLNVNGNGDVTFGGKGTTSVSTVLDNNGNGSVTIQIDPGTIQEGDTIDTTGSFVQTFEFDRSEASGIESPDRVFSALDGSVDITATVVDQFGDPVTGGFVEAYRTGANAAADTTPQRKAVGSDGTVTFTFTDVNATNGSTETVEFEYFADQFTNTPTAFGDTEIKYTTDGQGSNFVTSLDSQNTEAATYDASDVQVIPLTDTVADDDSGNESAAFQITNGENGADVTVSVDNGALILEPGEDELSEGSSSITDTVAGGSLPGGYRIIGTKAGVVTVTVTSANRTETSQFTVSAQDDTTQARNISVSGPAEVEHGTTQITYTAVITDAFGNPVSGVSVAQLNIQVSGPAQFQDSDAVSDANGQIKLNVRVDSGAEGLVTIRVQGLGSQFGAAEDRQTSTSPNDDGEGLPASSNIATASTTVKGEEVVTPPEPINPGLVVRGRNNGARNDNVVARAINLTEGATVRLFKKTANGLKLLRTDVMNAKGNRRFENIKDRNGRKYTKYVVKVSATDETNRGRGAKRLR